jgi:hypothetical protein
VTQGEGSGESGSRLRVSSACYGPVAQEGTKFWYADNDKFLRKGGKGASYFELEKCTIKDYDKIGFTVIPSWGPVSGIVLHVY